LPKVQQDPELARTQQYMNEQLNNKVFVVVDAKDEAAIQQATHFLTAQAKQSLLWQPLKPQLDFDQFAKQLYQHRVGLLSAQDQALLQKKDYAALTEQSLMQMMSPGMPVTAESLKQDPLLLFPRYAMQLATPSQQDIEMEQGFATIHHEQGISRLFVLQLTQSPYNIDYQEQTSTWIEQTKQKLAAMGLKSHWTGSAFAHYGLWRPSLLQFRLEALWRLRSHIGCLVKFT